MDYGYFTKIWEDNTSTDTPAFAPKLDTNILYYKYLYYTFS